MIFLKGFAYQLNSTEDKNEPCEIPQGQPHRADRSPTAVQELQLLPATGGKRKN